MFRLGKKNFVKGPPLTPPHPPVKGKNFDTRFGLIHVQTGKMLSFFFFDTAKVDTWVLWLSLFFIIKVKSKFSGKLIAAPWIPTKKQQNTGNSKREVFITDFKLRKRN